MKKFGSNTAKSKRRNFEFRVIAGSLKGRLIKAPDLGVTRPPLTRLRKAIFDFLSPYLPGTDYLDLFSGTGSYLFEAVSRGVVSATGVELEKKLVDAINKQAEKYHVTDSLTAVCDDVLEIIKKYHQQKKQFDIIMIAPPQYSQIIDKTLLMLNEFPIVKKEHMLLCQHDTSETKHINFLDFEIFQQRKYGNTTFSILKHT